MQGDNQEQIIKLAAQIAVEKDSSKFHALAAQLYDLLEERQSLLDKPADHSPDPELEPDKS